MSETAGPFAPPASISTFVGRAAELETLAALLRTHRLVTLVGPGGTGKTRLTVERLNLGVDDLPVRFVGLEPVATANQLRTAVAAALDVRDPSEALTADTIRAALGDRAVRLVLDGAELLVDEVRELVTRLLAAAPGLRVLVTSRRVLDVPGEAAWAVPQLQCPPAEDDDAASDAVALFYTRARERVPGLAADHRTVAELCRRLGGLPLAIELTAAWTGTLSVEQILRDRAGLLASLGDVVRRSYDVLSDRERATLHALSTFAGDFGYDDARSVAGRGDDPEFAADLRTLVDSSWLVVHDLAGERRYSLLETLREFARERLAQAGGEAEARRRHAEHFAAVAELSESGLAGTELPTWLVRMRAADADLLQALRWVRDHRLVDLGLRLAAPLWRWWLASGQLVTGRRWLAAVLAGTDERSDPLVARALRGAAILAAENNDPAAAVTYASRALAAFEAVPGAEPDAALAATILGSALRYQGEEAAARQQFERALALRRQLGDERGIAAALNNLALLRLDSAELEEAGRLLSESLAIKRRLGEPRAIALGLCNLSEVLVRTGRLDEAERVIDEATARADELGDKQLAGGLLCNAGDLAAKRGQWAIARARYEEALRVHGEAGNEHDVIVAVVGLGRALHRAGEVDEALARLRQAESMAERAGNQQRLAYVRLALSELTGRGQVVPPAGVTARQAEVLGHLAAGLSNREIAESLHLSVATVERHLATVYRNLGLRGRVAAARFATEHGLLPATRA